MADAKNVLAQLGDEFKAMPVGFNKATWSAWNFSDLIFRQMIKFDETSTQTYSDKNGSFCQFIGPGKTFNGLGRVINTNAMMEG